MKSSYKYPKVFADISDLYQTYFLLHPHLPKSFRLTTGETILQELSDGLKKIAQINTLPELDKHYHATTLLQSVRSSMAAIRALLNMGWELKVISNGNMIKLQQHINLIEKQLTAWQQWFAKIRT